MKSTANTIGFETVNKTEKAIIIWNTKLNPIQRIELRNEIGANKYSQISRMYNACINYISENLEKFN